MDVFLLGAGRPFRGEKPAALKNIFLNTRAIDWQVHSFDSIERDVRYHFIGGYHVEEVIACYPDLGVTVVPDWEQLGVLNTLLNAPFAGRDTVVSYTDTVFRKNVITDLLAATGDFAFAVDTSWKRRYALRSQEDIDIAETIEPSEFGAGFDGLAEFTGLMLFGPRVVEHLTTLDADDVGSNLRDLAFHLRDQGFTPSVIDVEGDWAELNAPEDIARFVLGTKADTLARLEPLVTKSTIAEQESFTTEQWADDEAGVLADIRNKFPGQKLIVRSSASAEDGWTYSNAGRFESILNVDGNDPDALRDAIGKVIASYPITRSLSDQVFVQPYVGDIQYAGVVFSRGLETGSPYYLFNFNDETMGTSGITSGQAADDRTIFVSRFDTGSLAKVEPRLMPILDAVVELEQLLGYDKLDVEFALTKSGEVFIFQVRPITMDHSAYEIEDAVLHETLEKDAAFFRKSQTPPPFVHGAENLFSNMSDWNPAEIIGAKPKPLAFSLYRHVITNDIWARQRAEFGYRNVAPHPLIVSFSGQPYVDVRASLNSFIPADLPDALAEKLATAYIRTIKQQPHCHDKIEFDVVFSVWTPSFQREAAARLAPHGIDAGEIEKLEVALKALTRNALTRLDRDLGAIESLRERHDRIAGSSLNALDKLIMLIEDCRTHGTLAFAHAARSGFVATSLLKSFVAEGLLERRRHDAFLQSVDTVSRQFIVDRHRAGQNKLSRDELLERYGHLRPGTYEITMPAYWEQPEKFLAAPETDLPPETAPFEFTAEENAAFASVLATMESDISAADLGAYLRRAIQLREAVKFEFTRNIGRALDLGVRLGEEIGISRSDFSYLEYDDLMQFNLNLVSVDTLRRRIAVRKKGHTVSRMIELPSVLLSETDFRCFERGNSEPNFITTNEVIANIHVLDGVTEEDLSGRIIVISQADPGYDWLIGYPIAGLITKFGGANSHMAVRAAEANLPAAIGVGEKIYNKIVNMNRVHLDCANRTISEVP
ncbi:MAG: hypothetical protein CMM77_09065 [Rhodospirillaceae bacterium]|nr:hypothetical protein [Rhodospirillaceae bacterium]